mmetsp:Transcript_27912/g.61143  ORF Transcript_27912/g.61143 Transcript_27912/m.61143 type:complete len:217 (+) Transcript_27912:1136-1786(+)
MIISVSTFCRSSGAAVPFKLTNLGMPTAAMAPLAASGSRMIGPADATAASYMVRCSRDAGPSAPSCGTGTSHSSSLRTSESFPVTAAAAAIIGETRCVRPPAPCRPSKLRLDVEAQRSCMPSLSAFIARHMEQPGIRQSKPASISTLSSPSSSACSLTMPEPGTTMACTLGATFLPLATDATARMSSMRPFVHEPMNTLSMAMESSGWPTRSERPM